MKEGFVLPIQGQISDEEIKLINKFTKRIMNKGEIYVFSLVLCDNEIDREYEQFSNDSLRKLSDLFVGKTGILDHDAKADKQLARIFWCKYESLKRKNSLGENYSRLVAKAYIPRTKENESIILEIDSGIKKEVSVRCLLGEKTCSICGNDINLCPHKKGNMYFVSGKQVICYSILENPVDAYEWSFVAIPTQTSAGVVKTFSDSGGRDSFDLLEKIKSESSKKGMKNLYKSVKEMEDTMKIGKNHVSEVKNDVLKFMAFIEPRFGRSIMTKIMNSLPFQDLKNLHDSLKQKILGFASLKPQLALNIQEKSNQFSEFKI